MASRHQLRSTISFARPSSYNIGRSDAVPAILYKLREPVAEYQLTRGIPDNEFYTFTSLIKALCQSAYNAFTVMFTMLCHLLPLLEGFTYFYRFVLDSLIAIFQTTNRTERIVKIVVFTFQLVILFLLILLIMTIIIYPLCKLFIHIGRNALSLITGRGQTTLGN